MDSALVGLPDSAFGALFSRALTCCGEVVLALRWSASPSKIGDIPAPPSSSPISSTATSHETRWDHLSEHGAVNRAPSAMRRAQ
jgi:hypothetical protein